MPVIDQRQRPLRNRVTPWNEIVAVPQRGALMGNRGRLHDDQGHIIKHAAGTCWVSCTTTWPGISRTLMSPTSYTELFFSDEPAALAAGHRPCWDCRRDAFYAFKAAWAKAHDLPDIPTAKAIDAVLDPDRRRPKQVVSVAGLPDGAMVAPPGTKEAWLIQSSLWRRWSFGGYENAEAPLFGEAVLLTPPSIVRTIRAGYRPVMPQ